MKYLIKYKSHECHMDMFSLGDILIPLMFMTLVLDMGGGIGLRNITVFICVILLVLFRPIRIRKEYISLFIVFVLYPTFLLFIGINDGADIKIAISQYQSTVLSFIILVILSESPYIFLAKSLYISIFLTALIATVLWVSLLFQVDIIKNVLANLKYNSVGYFGIRAAGDSFVPNIYFKATLFYVPAAFYFLSNNRIAMYSICLLGCIAAISKTGIIVILAGTIYYIYNSKGVILKILLASLLISVVYIIILSPVRDIFIKMQESDSIIGYERSGHLKSIINIFSDNPIRFMFGFGLGTEYYSEGVHAYVTNIELDHINSIRKYGLIWFTMFFGIVMITSIKAIKNNDKDIRTLGLCLVTAFFVSGTNPVLLSPVFFLILYVTILANIQSAS